MATLQSCFPQLTLIFPLNMFKTTVFRLFLEELRHLLKMGSWGASASANSTAWVEYLLFIISILCADLGGIGAARELQRECVCWQRRPWAVRREGTIPTSSEPGAFCAHLRRKEMERLVAAIQSPPGKAVNAPRCCCPWR